MATTFVMEVSERYRILVVVGATDRGWHYYPRENSEQRWNWMRDYSGCTVCFRSESGCRQYIRQVREEHEGTCEVCGEVCDVRSVVQGVCVDCCSVMPSLWGEE